MNLNENLKSTKTIGIVLIIIVLIDLIVHYKAMHNAPQLPIPTVIIKKPELKKVTEYVTQTGNTVAFNAVNLVARVEGYLEKITFTDGTFVKKGHPLFVIEPQPYMEKVKEAKASVAAQQASYAYAKAEYERQKKMYKENATSLNNVEKWLAKSLQTEAEITKAVANAAIAEINYSYTHLEAPFDGRIGRHLIDAGNLVGNGVATNLATIEQIDPIYVYFNLNELDLIKLRAAARAQGYDTKNIGQIPVYVRMQNSSTYQFEGKLDFINTGLNASTGTMEFRALLPNQDHTLVPGLFVDVRVATTKPTPRLTVPDIAVQFDQIGAYLFIVDQNNAIVVKHVKLGTVEQGSRAILSGLDAQDNVVISGLQNASPGIRVNPQPEKKST